MTATTRLAAALLGLTACLAACGSLKLKPTKGAEPGIDCLGGIQQKEDVFSGLEDSLRRAGAFWTPKMKLFSSVGMMEKTARLYVLNRERHVLILHLMHDVNLEIKDYRFTAAGDSAEILSGTLRIDTKHTIGQYTDEYLYLDLSGKEADALARETEVRLKVGDIAFAMPFACREPLRNAVGNVTAREAGDR